MTQIAPNVLLDLASRHCPMEVSKSHIVYKFVEMVKDFNFSVMMEIPKVVMVVILIVKYSLVGAVQEDQAFRPAHAFLHFLIKVL